MAEEEIAVVAEFFKYSSSRTQNRRNISRSMSGVDFQFKNNIRKTVEALSTSAVSVEMNYIIGWGSF